MSIYQAISALVMLFYGKEIFGLPYDESVEKMDFYYEDETPTNKCIHYTIVFNVFVF